MRPRIDGVRKSVAYSTPLFARAIIKTGEYSLLPLIFPNATGLTQDNSSYYVRFRFFCSYR